MAVVPLMRKALAKWLISNTSLTFEQIANFCDFHVLQIKGMADGEVEKSIAEVNPITQGELTLEEIKRCESDPNAELCLSKNALKINHANQNVLVNHVNQNVHIKNAVQNAQRNLRKVLKNLNAHTKNVVQNHVKHLEA